MTKLALQIGLIGGAAAGILLLVSLVAGRWILTTVMGEGYGAAAGVMNWQVAAAAIGVMTLPLEPMLVSMRAAGAALVGAAIAMAIGMFLTLRLRLARSSVLSDNEPSCADDANDAKGGR